MEVRHGEDSACAGEVLSGVRQGRRAEVFRPTEGNVTNLNSCHRQISGERRSALAALRGTLPEQEPSNMRQVMRNVTLCLIATWIAISFLTSSVQAAAFGSSEWWQQMDSDGRGGRGG